MPREDVEEFAEQFPIVLVLKRLLPLGIAVLIIAFFLIVIFVPESVKLSALIVAIFGVFITFSVLAKRYAERLTKGHLCWNP